MRSGRFRCLLVASLCLSGCLEPAEPGSLEVTLRGPAYPRPRCAKGPASLGMLYPQGEPVADAALVLDPGDLRGTTDASGRVVLEQVPEGVYTLQVQAASFVPDKDQTVVVRAGRRTTVVLNLHPCSDGGGDWHRVGFGKRVTLTSGSLCGGEWQQASFTWSQVEGPDIRDTVADWNRKQLVFTTKPLDQVRALPDDPQILSFSPDQAGEYVFQVVAQSPSGLVSKDYVMVTSTNVTGGMNSVPPYDTFYFLGYKQGPWKWTIDKWPDGWIPTIEGETTRTPSVRLIPDKPFAVQPNVAVRDEISGLIFSLSIGYWDMVNRDCDRSGCHPPLQRSWEKTRHGMAWRKLLDGELLSARGEAGESCATCHSLGYDRSVPNGGYDDIAARYRLSFPAVREPGNYDALPSAVKEVSNIYCLACHGPARVDPPVAEQPGRFEVGVCARCHDRLPEQDLVAQWRRNRMAQTIKGDINGPEARAECARCHTGQGFYYKNFALGRPPSSGVVVMSCCENLAPISCQICHSPMYANNKAQLFAYDTVKTDSGLDLEQVGTGAICIHCHNTEHDVTKAKTLADRLGPHSPQADVSYGRAGFVLDAPGYPTPSGVACSKTAGDGCATCHMEEGPPPDDPGYRTVGDHTFHVVSSEGIPNARPCQACHPGRESFDPRARHDYDGSGKVESVRKEVDGLMDLLEIRLSAAIAERGYTSCDSAHNPGVWIKRGFAQKIVVVDAAGFDLGDCDRNGIIEREESPFLFPDQDLLLHKAAYNYLLVAADKSRGLHNLPYVVSLLQRTIFAVTGGVNLPAWDLYKPPDP